MKAIPFVIFLILHPYFTFSQDYIFEFNSKLVEVNSLIQTKEYKKAALTYDKLFSSLKSIKINNTHYYNASCYWAISGDNKKAFHYLNLISRELNFNDYQLLISDTVLNSLHNDDKWEPLVKRVKSNAEINAKRPFTLYMDSLNITPEADLLKREYFLKKMCQFPIYPDDYYVLMGQTNNLGKGFLLNNNGTKAIFWLEYSLNFRKTHQLIGTSAPLVNLGHVYSKYGQKRKALEYYRKALKLSKSINKCDAIAWSYFHIGRLQTDSSFYFYEKAYHIWNECSNREGGALGYIFEFKADTAFNSKNYKTAIVLSHLGIAMDKRDYKERLLSLEDIGSYHWLNLANAYYQVGNLDSSYYYANKSVTYQRSRSAGKTIGPLRLLIKIATKKGNLKTVVELYKELDSLSLLVNDKTLFNKYMEEQMLRQKEQDSLFRLEEKKLNQAQLDLETEKSLQLEKDANNKKIQLIIAFGGIVLSLVLALIAYRRFQQTRKQKTIIEEQKVKVDAAYTELGEKNKEILDSINYAKRIQSAILPPQRVVKSYLEQSFILYKPKDIVAGDFYWLESFASPTSNNGVLFAACDCTGHGVPGAMVSVVCHNGLNRAVREFGLTEPGKILDKTREIVLQEFSKSDDEVKDGMDIALCSLEGNLLKYAGANNSLWIIRKNTNEIEEIKADKQPIGKFDKETPFTTHDISLNSGDSVYIFSDGYVDQFGGEKGKKFKASNLKSLLLSIQDKSMDEQKNIINETFEVWKRNYEQVDDVCVIGVRV